MENVVFTQLTIPEIKQLFRHELETYFAQNKQLGAIQVEADQILTIDEAALLVKLTVPTIYGLVHRSGIPYSKKGRRLYFSKQELIDWIKSGRRKTNAEIEAEANKYAGRKRQ